MSNKKITVNPNNKKAIEFFDMLDVKRREWNEKADKKLNEYINNLNKISCTQSKN